MRFSRGKGMKRTEADHHPERTRISSHYPDIITSTNPEDRRMYARVVSQQRNANNRTWPAEALVKEGIVPEGTDSPSENMIETGRAGGLIAKRFWTEKDVIRSHAGAMT